MASLGAAADDGGSQPLGDPPEPQLDGSLASNLTNLIEAGDSHKGVRSFFLALFIVVSFTGNCVLLATIVQSRRLKRASMNIFVISAAVTNMVNALINMPLILGATVTESWDYSVATQYLCQTNAFFVQLCSVTMMLSLTGMSLDRCIAVHNPSKYPVRVTMFRINVYICYLWAHGFVFCFPLIIQVVPSAPFPARYLCSIAQNGQVTVSLLYVSMTSVLCYIIPIMVIIASYTYILRTAVKQKLKERERLAAQDYTDNLITESPILIEIKVASYVAILITMWAILEGPYLLLNYIEQYRNSEEFLRLKTSSKFSYPWQMDLGFTWMKLSHPMILPFVTFIWRKDVWQKFKNLVLCRKSNLINDASPRLTPDHQEQCGAAREEEQKEAYMNSTFTAPVLFATSAGLHVQTYSTDSDLSDADVFYRDVTANTKVADYRERVKKTKKIDVDINYKEDTSDYDSQGEIDPFSVSNPITTKERDQIKHSRGRRNSDQQSKCDSPGRSSLGTIKQTVIDSGIDSNSNTNEKKKKKKKKKSSNVVEKFENVNETVNHSKVTANSVTDSGIGIQKEESGVEIDNSLKSKTAEKEITVADCEGSQATVETVLFTDEPVAKQQDTPVKSEPVSPTHNDNADARMRKKKKRRKSSVNPLGDGDELPKDEVSTEKSISPNSRPLRLEPIDPKQLKSGFPTNPNILTPCSKLPLEKTKCADTPIDKTDKCEDRKISDGVVDGDSHPGENSSSPMHKAKTRKRSKSACLPEGSPASPDMIEELPPSGQIMHSRSSTCDSQTALLDPLNHSGNSGALLIREEKQSNAEKNSQNKQKKKRKERLSSGTEPVRNGHIA